MKRIFALLLVSACLMTGVFAPVAAEASVSSENKLQNGNFEVLNGTFPQKWGPVNSAYVTLDKTMQQHDGSAGNTVKLSWPKGMTGLDPYVVQTLYTEINQPTTGTIKSNTRYQIGLWVRADWENGTANTTQFSTNLRFDFEFYSGAYDGLNRPGGSLEKNPVQSTARTGTILPTKTNTWEYRTVMLNIPEGTTRVNLLCRLRAPGITAWVDDISLTQIEPERAMEFRPDQFFYYPDVETGYATVRIHKEYETAATGGSVDFALLSPEGTTIKAANCPLTEDGTAAFSYPLAELQQRQKTAFTIRATLKDQSGNEVLDKKGSSIEPYDREIYVYPRPTRMREDGMLYDTYHAGEIYMPTSVCGTSTSATLHAAELKAAGFDLLHLSGGPARQYWEKMKDYDPTNVEAYEAAKKTTLLYQWLEQLKANEMRAVVTLYDGGQPAAYPTHAALTRLVVTDFKDHPAVGAWGIMDEPYYNLAEPDYWMIQSHKLVRDLDDKNPTHVIEMVNRMDITSAYCDFPGVDPYPGGTVPAEGPYWETYPNCSSNPATLSDEATAKLRRTAQRYKKPFITFNQSFTYFGYTPSLGDMRSFYYQSLLGDTAGVGWYAYVYENVGIKDLQAEEYEAYFTELNAEEQILARNLFGRTSQYPVFNQYENNQYLYKSVLANDDIYFVVLNRKAETQTIDVSLQSMNGLVTAYGKPYELYAIGESAQPVVSGDVLRVTLPPAQVSLIKMSCPAVRESVLDDACFDDLSGTTTEKNKIEKLYRSGILEGTAPRTFSQAAAITRGEFIKGLMRALDLEEYLKPTDTEFTDNKDKNAPYYREVQMAKNMGIVSGDTCRPTASLTKGEALELCEKALRAAMRIGETAFSYGDFATRYADTVTRAEAAALLYTLWN